MRLTRSRETISQEGVALTGLLDPYQLGPCWQRSLQTAPWIRLAGTILGAIAAARAITYGVIRLSGS